MTETKMTFKDLGLPEFILNAVSDLGFETPSPIQQICIPHLLEGRDVLGMAQTGSGKTAAFSLPILAQIDPTEKHPQLLVMAPTRELAIQVAEKTGLPEARIALSSAVIELASSKKTNIAEKAIDLALADLDVFNTTIPMHLRDTHFKGATSLGHTGYVYPHDYKNHYIQQQYMPDELIGHNYIIDENPIDEHVNRVVKFAKRKSDSDLNNFKN